MNSFGPPQLEIFAGFAVLHNHSMPAPAWIVVFCFLNVSWFIEGEDIKAVK
jgi:hypothetical protein